MDLRFRQHHRTSATALRRHSVTLVCGPPLGGKSFYVRQHALPGDLILDTDEIGSAISGQSVHETPAILKPFVFTARDAVLAELQRTVLPKRVWVIETAPDPQLRARLRSKWNASEVIMMLTPAEVCRERLLANPRPCARLDCRGEVSSVDWMALVYEWWQAYRPGDGERVILPPSNAPAA